MQTQAHTSTYMDARVHIDMRTHKRPQRLQLYSLSAVPTGTFQPSVPKPRAQVGAHSADQTNLRSSLGFSKLDLRGLSVHGCTK